MNLLPTDYPEIISRLKERIRSSQQRAALIVNRELLDLYWELGHTILSMQQSEGWGARVIDRLSADLKADFPEFKGLSVRNLKYMRAFAEAYPEYKQASPRQSKGGHSEFVQVPPAQLTSDESEKFVQAPLAQLTWYHHCTLLDKIKDKETRLFYIHKTVENGWSRNVMLHQIESGLHVRIGTSINNFALTLPSPQSDLAIETIKNPYVFDFLSIGSEMNEKDLERALANHIKQFLLELGKGFAYMGNQKNLVVAGDDFFLDLLFYNVPLKCYVIVELKVGDFKPEYAGKLNFYVNTVNAQLKDDNDRPTIGVLLCKTPNETVVKYSLQDIKSPIGVSNYKLLKSLPKTLKGDLPSIEELEAEIDKEYEELKSPGEKKWDALKQKLANINQPKLEVPVTYELLCAIVDQSLIPLFEQVLQKLKTFNESFLSTFYFWSGSNNLYTLEELRKTWMDKTFLESNRDYYFHYSFKGIKALGTETFDVSVQLNFNRQNIYWYGISISNHNNNQPIVKKLYNEQLTSIEKNLICERMYDHVVEDIERYYGYWEQEKMRNL